MLLSWCLVCFNADRLICRYHDGVCLWWFEVATCRYCESTGKRFILLRAAPNSYFEKFSWHDCPQISILVHSRWRPNHRRIPRDNTLAKSIVVTVDYSIYLFAFASNKYNSAEDLKILHSSTHQIYIAKTKRNETKTGSRHLWFFMNCIEFAWVLHKLSSLRWSRRRFAQWLQSYCITVSTRLFRAYFWNVLVVVPQITVELQNSQSNSSWQAGVWSIIVAQNHRIWCKSIGAIPIILRADIWSHSIPNHVVRHNKAVDKFSEFWD